MKRTLERLAEPLLRAVGSLFYPSAIFSIPSSSRSIYLTFDDGPTPGVTDEVFELLARYDAKASFFWIGKNIDRNPDYLERAKWAGHVVGGHCLEHENGWKTDVKTYVASALNSVQKANSSLFRPPYGRIRPAQYRAITGKGVSVVFWSRLSYDFDVKISAEECILKTTRGLKPGELIVFHDSLKAEARMLPALEALLQKGAREGWQFAALS